MREFLKSLSCVAALGLAAVPAFAQDTAAPADAPAAATTETTEPATPAQDPTLSMGQDVTEDKVGTSYVKETHGDWEMRCIHAPEGQSDPCQLYQLLADQSGNSVAEISFFYLNGEKGAAAGATVVTPLETLLTQNLRLAVDGGKVKKYPFAWCSQVGCFARLGFTPDEIAQFKRGKEAKMTIVPVAAPDQLVELTVSLGGFTAGYDALVAAAAPQ
ncbi:invasion associated locus B family protein [Actibacterium sp. D379-3]